MEKFDNIDIFFIMIIGIYFITLLCIILSLTIIGIKKIIKVKKAIKIKPIIPSKEDANIIIEESKKTKKIKKGKERKITPTKPRHKLSELFIIQKLFMKKTKSKVSASIAEKNIKGTEIKGLINPKPINHKTGNSTINDTAHVNVNKYNTDIKPEKIKYDLDEVIEQISKEENLEASAFKNINNEERFLQETITEASDEMKNTSKPRIEDSLKLKAISNNSNNKSVKKENTSSNKNSTKKSANTSQNRTKKNLKKKKNNYNSKKKSPNSNKKKTNKKKTVKRKKS